MTTVLETENLERRFGRLVAVDDVSVSIEDDEITSIIGPNGAGKTTLYNLLAGQLDPTNGTVHIRNPDDGTMVDITGKEPFEINKMGLSRAFQINNVFDGLTVLDNLRIARISNEGRTLDFTAITNSDEELSEGAWDVIELANLEEVAETKCANLSHGDKRKVEIALALGTDPSVVLLDEPTAGMNQSETERIVDLIDDLDRETDTTFVVTEHDMNVVVDISDRILVLDGGELIADGTPEEVMADERVREAYLGDEIAGLNDGGEEPTGSSDPDPTPDFAGSGAEGGSGTGGDGEDTGDSSNGARDPEETQQTDGANGGEA